MILSIKSNPFRTVLRWQAHATLAMAMAAALWGGAHAALSALLGGLVIWLAGLMFAILVSGAGPQSAAATLRTILRAEAGKVTLIVMMLWLVLTTYHEVVLAAFFTAFVMSVLVSQAAILVRDGRTE